MKHHQEPNRDDPEWLPAFVATLPDYRLEYLSGIAVIRPRIIPPITSSLLHTKLASFNTGPATISALSMRLWMELQLKISNPKPTSFTGVLHSQDGRITAGLKLKNVTVQQVLIAIVKISDHAAWIVLPPPPKLQGEEQGRLWGIVRLDEGDGTTPVSSLCCLNRESLK